MGDKFEFGIDFQWNILKFILTSDDGYKALPYIKRDYFELLTQEVIFYGVEKFYRKRKKLPRLASTLNEQLRTSVFNSKDYAQELKSADRTEIQKRVRRLYKSKIKDSEEVLDSVKKFASYIEFKDVLEGVNLNNFSQYETYSKKIQKAINIGIETDDTRGSFMVNGIKGRTARRSSQDSVIPTPFRQLNQYTNAGGYGKGSVIVLVDKEKGGKTNALVNVARGYLASKKKVIYFDLENGQEALEDRLDQSIIRKTKKEILSGEFDSKLAQVYRRYNRLGGEIYVVRLPAFSTTDHFQKIIDEVYQEYGIKFNVAIVDYMGKAGSLSNKKEDTDRISDAYVDISNFAIKNDLDALWTGHHVTRDAIKKRPFKYDPQDIAKCIDIARHVDALIGLNQNEDEEQHGVLRMEIIEQRDGKVGTSYFWLDHATQRMDEFTKNQLDAYLRGIPTNKSKVDKTESSNEKREKVNDL